MVAGIIDVRHADPERIYLQAFERRGGLDALFGAIAGLDSWDLDLSDKLYDIYLAHIRHVVAARRDIEYFRDLSEHMLRVRDSLKRSNPSLSRRIGVLEDIVDESLAALPSVDRPARSRKHIIDVLKTLDDAGSMKRSELRRRHELGDANTSRILRDMEEEGLLARRQCGRDVTVQITAAGREELSFALQQEGVVPRGKFFDLDADNSPDAIASFVLARLSPERFADEADEEYPVLFGRDLGATVARYCGSGSEGERKFDEVWTRLIASPLASRDPEANAEPPKAGRFRLAMMSLLQFYAREAADANAIQARKAAANSDPLAAIVLDVYRGHWKDALETANQLRNALEAWPIVGPRVLTIGVSGYHEERIIGKLASDIFLIRCGYDGLQLASSPWAFEGVLEGLNEAFGPQTGSADIRLVNAASKLEADNGKFLSNPVFQHKGYRAFANRAWLKLQVDAEGVPDSVRKWVASYFDGESPSLFGPETIAERAWLCLRGKPLNYEKTEFPALFEYLHGKCAGLGGGEDVLIPPPARDDPDDVFETFVRGKAGVIVSGSIHDLLLQNYWVSPSGPFLALLNKSDFADWYSADARVGLNFIRFSERLATERHLAELVQQLYEQALRAAVNIVRDGREETKRALLAYIATILAPSHRENWNTDATDTRWSFAGNVGAVRQLLLEEMVECPAPRASSARPGNDLLEVSGWAQRTQ